MDSVHLDKNGDCFTKPHVVEKFLPPECDDSGEAELFPQILSDSYHAFDKFGVPEILPRIGDEYQVELPPLTGQIDYMLHTRKATDEETTDDQHKNFVVGLPVRLTRISSLEYDIMGSFSSSTTSSNFRHADSRDVIKTEISSGEVESSCDKIQTFCGPGSLMVPGLVDEQWSTAVKDSFILGLYIFKKNFVEVRRFVGNKEMGSLLSFYYGKFYGSQEYHRWSQCRKMKSKKCIIGYRIFSGLRQQELLSRVLPRVSEECQSALLEVSKTFTDEKMSLADYVSSLKAMVGMSILVEAVGIGTGKQDLTGMALEPSRSNQVIHLRPEIPAGKACSSLTTTEIIKFLSGDYRLSKARSNDLFWEAVWPRLLARGWHSEQPKGQKYVSGSKHCLVFLIPGVKKFSRSKLVKGDHYFDSVTDVLSKVAQDPGLIELDSDGDDGSKKPEEYELTGEKKSVEGDDNLPLGQSRRYLQPRTPNCRTAVVKFTVVDTSLSDGKVRELRTLPSEFSNAFIAQDHSEDSDEETSDGSDAVDTYMLDASVTDNFSLKTEKSDEKPLPGGRNHDLSVVHQDAHTVYLDNDVSIVHQHAHTVYPDNSATLAPDLKNKKVARRSNQSRKVSKSHLSCKQKKGNIDYEADQVDKQRKILTSCGQKETNAGLLPSLTAHRLENGTSSCCTCIHEVTENLSSQAGLCPDKLSSTNSLKGSPGESVENPLTQTLIDLNVPQVSPDSENGILTTELCKGQDSSLVKLDDHCLQKSSGTEVRSEQQPNSNPLRHSTRNRPPTSRALEALADGYLTVNRKRKGKDINSRDLASSPSQRARVLIQPNESTNISVDSQIGEAKNGGSNSSNCSIFSGSQVPPQANEESVSGH